VILIVVLGLLALLALMGLEFASSFSSGLHAFRGLKAIGDLDERLGFITDAEVLAQAVDDANEETQLFIGDTLRRGAADPEAAACLRRRYQDICDAAAAQATRLREVEARVEHPGTRRIITKALEDLDGLKRTAADLVDLLWLLESGDVTRE
jgi:hypothetical protein